MQRALILFAFITATVPVWAESQPIPEIDLDPAIECWYHSDFPMLTARVNPSEEIVNSRLYFRCSSYPDYYFVDLQTEGGSFTGVAPQAEESCPRVHYYVEAVTRDFTSARTPERVADVTSANECRRRNPTAAFFPGDDPQIVLGSTIAGPELAPGFKDIGVTAFMSASGSLVAAGTSGGASTAVVVGVAGAAAAAAGVGVLASGGSSDPPPPAPMPVTVIPPPAVTPPAVTGPPPAPPAQEVKACVQFEPANAVVDINQPLVIDGRCSGGGDGLTFRYDLGDGRVREGQPFITVVYSRPGTYSLTLTVERPDNPIRGARLVEEDTITRTVRVNEPFETPVPAFQVFNVEIDSCFAEFDASSTTGDVEEYLWDLDTQNNFGEGVIRKSGRVVRHHWQSSGCFRAQGNTNVRLTVVGKDGRRVSLTKGVNVLRFQPLGSHAATLRSSVALHFIAEEGARAQIVLPRGQTQPVAGGAPSTHNYEGVAGSNTAEAVVMAPLSAPALLRFDFTASSHFVAGSVRVVGGVEVARDARSVVVRLTGRAGERVRITYELAR